MLISLQRRCLGKSVALALAATSIIFVYGCGGDDDVSGDTASTFNVAKATCGPNDKPETDLQGQV